MIKTIIFDLGGVIVPLDFPHACQEISAYTPHSPEEIRRRLAASDLYSRAELGTLGPDDFRSALSSLLDLTADETEFRRAWCSVFPARTLIEDELIEQLHRSYRILLLSNTNVIHFEWIREKYPILRHFDGLVLSYEVGHMKPAPEIYREAVRMAGCRPEECFFTDDIAAYVEGARAYGIDAVVFENAGQTARELRARGLDL